MADEYSLYDAKARLSALVREVREGKTIVITVHGVPAAELRPIEKAPIKQTLADRLADMDSRGEIISSAENASATRSFPVGPRKAGALKRFLTERE